MINEEKTFVKYGYRTSDLSIGSSRKIIVTCDYCQEDLEKPYKMRLNQNKELDRDCCQKCKFKKREELSLLKHGVKNSAQRKDVKEKLSHYNIEDYKEQILLLLDTNFSISNISKKIGIPVTSLNRYLKSIGIDTKGELQQKKEKTLEEKYGKNYQEKMLTKRIETNTQKFGCSNPFANQDIKVKIIETMKMKYGTEHHMQNPDKIQQVKETNLDKYGVANVSQVPEFKDKMKNTNLIKYGYEYATQNLDIKNKIVNTMVLNGNARLFEGNNASFWAEKTGYCLSRFNQLIKDYGFEHAKNMYRTDSYTSLELRFKSFLDEHHIVYKNHQRVNTDNNNKYYIPDFIINNLFIEIDGLYWHSDNCRENNYHINKKTAYESIGYDSLFFREDEIRDKFDIVKSIVLNKLGKSEKLYARNCILDTIDNKTSDSFFEANHLMGKGRGVTYVLKNNDVIVSAIRIKRLKNKDYEISRFCNKVGHSVIGGFSKLLKHSLTETKPDQLITFIDKRYGKGQYLTDLGFEYVHTYPSFRWTDGSSVFHRLKFSGNTGYDNGLFKIWDCGQAKWILKT